jgi:hypothetical protein
MKLHPQDCTYSGDGQDKTGAPHPQFWNFFGVSGVLDNIRFWLRVGLEESHLPTSFPGKII